MKTKNLLLVALAAVSMACGEQKAEEPAVEAKTTKFPNGVTYEIFVQSFNDTDGDGIGDFNGVTEKLDYIKDLGVSAIWFMPIMPSPSYHKYDVTDYKAVHPDYGTMEDFKRLLDEAHKRDIKIIIDLIINHTSDEHPWFLEAKKGPDNPYRDYYVWAQKDTIQDYLNKKTITLDSDNIRQWHDPGQGDQFYYGFFVGDMPDLNFDNPKVREEVYELGRFWLEDIGIDGLRMDAAKHIFPDERATDNHAFWKEFRDEMVKIKPDVYIVGEVYDNLDVVAPYLPGLPALFDFDFHYTLLGAFNESDGTKLVKRHQEILDFYAEISDDFVDATLLSNHDQNRILTDLGGDIRKGKVAAAVLFTMPGAPYIYYGEEIGMLGKKPDPNIREPFLWDIKEKDSGRTTWIEPVNTTDETVTPLALQIQDDQSIYNVYKQLIALRNDNAVLVHGELIAVDTQSDKSVMALERKLGNESWLIFHQIGDQSSTFTLPQGYEDHSEEVWKHAGATISDGQVTLPPFSTLILKK